MELNHKILGSGDPVIILHGMFGTLDNWQTIGRQLAEKYMVVLIDQRNHGRSPHIAGKFNYQTLADDLLAFMESHWMYDAAVIGHSMGGKAAMQFALDNPSMVNRLVVIDVAPKAYTGGHEQVFEALNAVHPETLTSRSEAELILRQHLDDEGTIQFLMKNLARDTQSGFTWKMNLPVIEESYPAILGNITTGDRQYDGPTLFIRGGRSGYINEAEFPEYLKWFPKATLETIPDAGHWVHAEQPVAVYEALLRGLGE